MSKQFYLKQFSLAKAHSFSVTTVLFPPIQFSISTQFSSIWPIDRTLSAGNYGIPQSYSITGTSRSDCLMSYHEYSLEGESYNSAEKQVEYSTAPVHWEGRERGEDRGR